MSDQEKYLAGVTLLGVLLYGILFTRHILHRDRPTPPGLVSRSLFLTDLGYVVLGSAAVTRNTFGLSSSVVWLSIAWTLVISCALARLWGPRPTRKGKHEDHSKSRMGI